MQKNDVIKLRTLLKAGKNLPLRIIVDNLATGIDERNRAQFIHWNDDEGYIIVFRLTDPQSEIYPSNVGRYMSAYTVTYEDIQGIENAICPLDDIKTILNNSGVDSTVAENVYKAFKQLLRNDLTNITSQDYSRIMGYLDQANKDEYYSNMFAENFLETRSTAANNKYVDSLKNKTDNTETSTD